MSDTLAQRLRHAADKNEPIDMGELWSLCEEAADEIERLRTALQHCNGAASGDRFVIQKHCSPSDRAKYLVDEGGLDSGTPLGIRVNTVGLITLSALSGSLTPQTESEE